MLIVVSGALVIVSGGARGDVVVDAGADVDVRGQELYTVNQALGIPLSAIFLAG